MFQDSSDSPAPCLVRFLQSPWGCTSVIGRILCKVLVWCHLHWLSHCSVPQRGRDSTEITDISSYFLSQQPRIKPNRVRKHVWITPVIEEDTAWRLGLIMLTVTSLQRHRIVPHTDRKWEACFCANIWSSGSPLLLLEDLFWPLAIYGHRKWMTQL